MPQREIEVASLDDIANPGLRQIDIEGTKILLFRDGDSVHAVGATCPHAGGPLAEGVRNGDRVVCPWHKATFCLRSGTVLEPPALDPLPRFNVRIDGRRILLTLPADQPSRNKRRPTNAFS